MMTNIHHFLQKPEHQGIEEALPPAYSEEALALQYAELHAEELRYVAAWRSWLWFDGTRWVKDATLQPFTLARELCRAASAECLLPIRMKIASANTIAAVERLAKADMKLAATVDQWDVDKNLLNTPGGTVDLRTGKISPHKPSDYCTKLTGAAPEGECPLWMTFLMKIFEGDTELIEFLQRLAGYVLTGQTLEHALFFFYGTGANGKSVVLKTLGGMLGDYHCTSQIETFTSSRFDRHPTDIARLCGARLVTASETEEGRHWAESRIKEITGGDPVAARFMHQNYFEYEPQFKLVIAGNHKPGLKSVDEAMRRRFHLVPFKVTIPPTDRDPTLGDKLKKEWSGILAWALQGCLKWQKTGLKPPEAVIQATADYLEAEDTFALWLEECCQKEPDAWESSKELFDSWRIWAQSRGEAVGSAKKLAQALEAKGFVKKPKSKARGFLGIRLLETAKAIIPPGGMGMGG
jgi:putative DNA primase/helicase